MPTFRRRLVRDKVPGRLIAKGKIPIVTKILARHFGRHLALKVHEDVHELILAHIRKNHASMIEASGDVLEALEAFWKEEGISAAEVAQVRAKKARTHGRFTKRIMLLGIKETKE